MLPTYMKVVVGLLAIGGAGYAGWIGVSSYMLRSEPLVLLITLPLALIPLVFVGVVEHASIRRRSNAATLVAFAAWFLLSVSLVGFCFMLVSAGWQEGSTGLFLLALVYLLSLVVVGFLAIAHLRWWLNLRQEHSTGAGPDAPSRLCGQP